MPGTPSDADRALLATWRAAEREPVEGWSFAALAGGISSSSPPWDFERIVGDALASARAVLDLGTGGGERLLALREALPADTAATEGWAPNLPVAAAALAPIGVSVLPYRAGRGESLPFAVDRFDLVMSRHEAFDAEEVARVLQPGGRFVTQQVGGDDLHELHERFGVAPVHGAVGATRSAALLAAAGLRIERTEEWHGPMLLHTVEALVRYLRRVPWYAPADFTVDRYAPVLLEAHAGLLRTGAPLECTQSRFVIVARATARRVPS